MHASGRGQRRSLPRLAPGLAILLLSWSLTRIMLVGLLAVDAEAAGIGDIGRYYDVADSLVAGRDVSDWEYPFGALAVVIPPVLLGATEGLDYVAAFVGLAIAFDFLALVGVLLSSPRGKANLVGGWIWVVGPFLLGVLSITRLDIFTCALAALGLSLGLRYRSATWSGFLLAAGASIKLWPGLLIIPLLVRRPGASRLVVGIGVAAGLLIAAAQAFQGWPLATSFLSYQRDRGLQIESFFALPLLWIDRLGLSDYEISYRFGSQQIAGPGADVLASLSTIAMAGALLAVAVLSRTADARRLKTEERSVWLGTLAVSALLVTNKVFSAQYILWLIVMVALLFGWTQRPERRVTAALLVAAGATHLVFPLMWDGLRGGAIAPLMALTVRDGLVLYIITRVAIAPFRQQRRPAVDDLQQVPREALR